jgi:hypothetical protein
LIIKGSNGISDSLDGSVRHGSLLGYEIADDMCTACPKLSAPLELFHAPKRLRQVRFLTPLRRYAFTSLHLYTFTILRLTVARQALIWRRAEEALLEDHRR